MEHVSMPRRLQTAIAWSVGTIRSEYVAIPMRNGSPVDDCWVVRVNIGLVTTWMLGFLLAGFVCALDSVLLQAGRASGK